MGWDRLFVLGSPRSMLAFAMLPAGDVLARGGSPVVVLRAGGAWFLFGPGFSLLIVPFSLGADLGLAGGTEVSLTWGSYMAARFPESSLEASLPWMFFLSLGAWMVLLAAGFLSGRAVCSSSALSVLS